MFCTVCMSQDSTSGQFMKGSTNFHTHSLMKHAERYSSQQFSVIMLIIGSVQHKSCMHVLSGHTSTAKQAQVSQLALLFRNAHAIAKAGRPFTDMEWMCALDEKKGLDVGMSYRTDKKCCEFIQCIAEEQQASLQASVQSGNFFPVMVDGTTDSSVTETELSTSGILASTLFILYC